MLQLDFDLLRTFVAIADTGSLTRAAAEVGRTQSAISMQLKRIEEIVDGTVLVRTARGVELTSRGNRLLAHARRLVRAHDEALLDVTDRGLTGSVRLGCPEDYCTGFLPVVLRAIAAQHPRVALEVVCAPTPLLEKMLDARRVDVALVSLAPEGNVEQVIRWEDLVWIASQDFYPPSEGPLQIALSVPETLDHQAARRALEAANVSYRVAYESVSKDGLLAIVRAGIAVAVVTRGAVPADLRIMPVGEPLPPLPRVGIAVASYSGAVDSLVVDSVKALMIRTLKTMSPVLS
ncbi:DNA-binding transcriptional LysR family regulator [Paraburkholderia sp. GAS41]|jgi:DNA-binding transcriptional LysR family regulator|uniref:LysR family transcriptional regulator n=1 Tax=Paraburkholderia sp. GAS41 TaxID=3035134 RepID=UPI003D19E193